MDPRDIVPIATNIAQEAKNLDRILGEAETRELANSETGRRVSSLLWEHPAIGSEIEQCQSQLLGLVQRLNKVLRGPRDFLHELVACNWDKGALYCLLDHDVFEYIPLAGTARLQDLADKCAIPAGKLLPMLRLAVCEQIIHEPLHEVFAHGQISRELAENQGLKAFLQFQLYETRVASAHLSDSVRQPNPFWTGQSAFKYAWGQSMYEWHSSHPEKGARFREAMQSVSESLDPGHELQLEWLKQNTTVEGGPQQLVVVEIVRNFEPTFQHLVAEFPSVTFKSHKLPGDLASLAMLQAETSVPQVYLLKSILWNVPDEECIVILRILGTHLEKDPRSIILINDLMSPAPGTFQPHVDKAYRRRDVTVMTMHNAKLRTAKDWRDLFERASRNFKVDGSVGYTSHSCRCQWELKWLFQNQGLS